jgi:hypothetical protein
MSHNLCAHPDCGQPLVEGDTVVGEVCHIKGEREGAARYDDNQSDAERHAYENLIGMCRKHHKIIDTEKDSYPVERPLEMKRQHEQSDKRRYVISDELVQRIGEMLAAGAEARSSATVAPTEILLLDAARRAYSETRGTPAAEHAEMFDNSPEEILKWYCVWFGQHHQRYGARRPSTKIEPVSIKDPLKDFHLRPAPRSFL